MTEASNPIAAPKRGFLSVGSLVQARREANLYDAVLTLESPNAAPNDSLRFDHSPSPDHLVLAFEDADHGRHGHTTMTAEQMDEVLAFGRRHVADSLLVHCLHGIGRSTACALAIIADRMGPGREGDALVALKSIRRRSIPNLVAVRLADAALHRDGALVRALDAAEAASPLRLRARRMRRAIIRMPTLYTRRQTA